MSIKLRRQAIAAALTVALADVLDRRSKVHPYRPRGARAGQGWLQLSQVDTEDTTYDELRLQFEVVILVSEDQGAFERAYDDLAQPLITACAQLGRGITVRPYTETVDTSTLYCVVASLTTESEE